MGFSHGEELYRLFFLLSFSVVVLFCYKDFVIFELV